MIYPDYDSKDWISKHNFPVKEYHCPKCAQTFLTTVPVITTGYVGIESPIHQCGDSFTKVILKPTAQNKKIFWSKII